MLARAYSILHVKNFDEEQRIIRGTASTPTPDSIGDIMEPFGAEFENPLPLLLHHDQRKPIGQVWLQATKDGISFEARLPKVTEPGTVRDRVDEAWHSAKYGLIRGASIGYRGREGFVDRLKSGGFHFKKYSIKELSMVTVPMNAEATIASIKSLDAPYLAASGTDGRVPSTPGVPGRQRKDTTMNVSEQLTARRAELTTKTARLEALIGKDDLNEAESEERDALTPDVKSLATTIERLEALESGQRLLARPVVETKGTFPSGGNGNPQQTHIEVNEPKLPKGIAFARLVRCFASAAIGGMKGDFRSPFEHAKEWYPEHTRLHLALKATAVPAGVTNATWASNLIYAETIADFVELLMEQTILGKFGTGNIPSLNRVPFNSRQLGQTVEGSAWWVGAGKPKPVTMFGWGANTLGFAKVAAITALEEEVIRFSNPSADTLVRNALIRVLRKKLDRSFIDPNLAAVANVNPASITNGVTPLAPSGTDADAVRADIATLLSVYIADNVDPTRLVFIMPNTLALSLALMRNGLGQKEFDGITMNGGTLEGIPVITSQLAANPSGAGNMVIAVNTEDINLADDGQVNIDLSREASLEMSDAPTQDGSAGTGAQMVSLWQNNLVGFRAERFITWGKRAGRNPVVYMDDVEWGGAGSPS